MQHAIAEMLSSPWTIERSRLQFVLGILARAAGQNAPPDATTQVRIHAAARAASGRQAGNGASRYYPSMASRCSARTTSARRSVC